MIHFIPMKGLFPVLFLLVISQASAADNVTEFFLNTEEYPDAADRLRDDVHNVNETLPKFKRVTSIKVRDTEFPKTTTIKIIRDRSYYENENKS